MADSIIGRLRVALGLDSAQFETGARRTESTAQKLRTALLGVGAGMTAASAGITMAVRGQLQEIDALSKAAQATGTNIEALSQLRFAADQSGVSAEQLDTALQRLSRSMAGGADEFAALGIALRDSEGNMRPTEAVLFDFADRLAAMPDGAEKTALAMDLLGRSGAGLIPLLNGGSDSLRGLMAEADRLGLTVSGETAANVEAFNDSMSKLQAAGTGLARVLIEALAPTLERVAEWVSNAAEWFGRLDPKMQSLITGGGLLVAALGPVVVTLGVVAGAVAAIGAPIAAVVTALAGLTAAFVLFKDDIERVMFDVAFAVIQWKDSAVEAIAGALAAFKALPGQMLEIGREIVAGLWQGIQERVGALRDNLTGAVSELVSAVKARLGIQSPSRVFAEIGRFLTEGLALGIRSGTADAVTAAGDMADGVAQAAQKSMLSLDQFASGFANFVGPILRGSQTVRGALASMFTGWGNRLFTSGLTGLGSIIGGFLGIPSFAGGGWTGNGARAGGLDGQGGFLAMMHPREAVIDTTRGGPGGIGGTVKIMVEVVEGAMFAPRVRAEAQGVAVEVVQTYDRSLPDRMAAIQQDPRARS